MKIMIRQLGEKGVNDPVLLVLTEIRVSVEMVAMTLGLKMTAIQVKVLVNDIYDTYKYESVEDIQQCLRKGRLGVYPFSKKNEDGMFEYFKKDILTFPLIRYWMSLHIEEKLQLRQQIEKQNEPGYFLDDIESAEQKLLEADTKTQEEHDKAGLAAIAKMKAMIAESAKAKQATKNVVYQSSNSEESIIKIINSNPETKAVYDRIIAKLDAGKELQEKELQWLEAWKILSITERKS